MKRVLTLLIFLLALAPPSFGQALLKHNHQSALPDDPTDDVSSGEWNDSHVLSGGSNGDFVTRDTGETYGASYVTPNAGTDITADLEEETHASEHQNGGADEVSIDGLSGNIPGNAATATALAANPTDCSKSSDFAHAIAADGDLTCTTPSYQIVFILGADNGAALGDTDDQPTIFWNQLGSGITITEVWCESDAGTPSVNLQRDDGTPADILSSNLSCSTSGAAGTIDTNEDNVADGDKIDFVMVTAGGSAARVTVLVVYTVD